MKKIMKLLFGLVMMMIIGITFSQPAQADTKKFSDLKPVDGGGGVKESSITTPKGKRYKNVLKFDASWNDSATYNLNKKYDTFEGVFVTSKDTGDGNFEFTIYGDDKELKYYKGITNKRQNISFSVNVTGVKTLRIESKNVGDWSNGFVFIADAELTDNSDSKTVELKAGKTTKASLSVGNKTTLKIKNVKKKIKWTTSKKTVAKVSSKGVVTAVKPGTATIKGKVAGKTYTCKMTVKNADAKAQSVKFANVTGGEFVKGSNATVSFKLANASTNVEVKILDSSNKAVYTKKYAKCKKNQQLSFVWNGKNSKGVAVSEGRYRVCIIAGTIKTYSKELTLCAQEFAGGDGSKTNPYQVSNLTQLRAVNRHNGYYFKQTKNIDVNYASFAPLFTMDNPFNGNYNGNNLSISNINAVYDSMDGVAIFAAIGEKGNVSNLEVKNCIFKGKSYVGTIAGENKGVIENCKASTCNVTGTVTYVGGITGYSHNRVKKCTVQNSVVSNNSTEREDVRVGGIVGHNVGIIDTCIINSSQIVGSADYTNVGGICGSNDAGTIVSCSGKDFTVTAITNNWYEDHARAGGVVGYNKGTVQSCNMIITLISSKNNDDKTGNYGGIAGLNESIISNCSFEGCDKAIGYNAGTLV